jgi:predicted DNA-binding transcriptional regulator YafY
VASSQQQPLKFKYQNWKGKVGTRNVIPIRIYWGHTDHHIEDQWLMEAYDLDKLATRTFAMKDMHNLADSR